MNEVFTRIAVVDRALEPTDDKVIIAVTDFSVWGVVSYVIHAP